MGSVLLSTIFLILCAVCLFVHLCTTEGKLFNAASCPLLQETWEEEANVYNCTGGTKYTCILNEKESFVKGCLPPYPVPANQTKCTFLVSSTQEVAGWRYFTNCSVTWQGCPPGTHPEYTISELWKYPQCLIREPERGPGIFTTIQVPTTAQTTVYSSVTSITSPRSTSGKLSSGSIAGIVVGILAGMLILAVVILFVVTWKRSGKGLGDFCMDVRQNGVIKTFFRRPKENTIHSTNECHPLEREEIESLLLPATELARLASRYEEEESAESTGHKDLLSRRRNSMISTDNSDSSSSGVGSDNTQDATDHKVQDIRSSTVTQQQSSPILHDNGAVRESARDRFLDAIITRNRDGVSQILNTEIYRRQETSLESGLSTADLREGICTLLKTFDAPEVMMEIIKAGAFDLDELTVKPSLYEKEVSILLYAAKCGQQKTVRTLLGMLKNINRRDKDERSVLHFAAEFGWRDIVEKVVELDDSLINEQTIENYTALIIAARLGHKEIMAYLMEKGASVLDGYDQYSTVIRECVTNGWQDVFRCILRRDKKMILRCRESASSPEIGVIVRSLLTTYEETCCHFFQIVVEEFPDIVNNSEYFLMKHPLIWAAGLKDMRVCKLLLSKMKIEDLENVVDPFGLPLIHSCIYTHWFPLFEHLVDVDKESHILINSRDQHLNSPIILAVKCGQKKFFDLLIDEPNVDIFSPDEQGRNILHECVRRNWYKRCLRILDRDIEKRLLNSQDYTGMTPLLIAVSRNSKCRLLEFLIQSGSDISKHDKDRNTVFHYFVDTFRTDDDNWNKCVNLMLDSKLFKNLNIVMDFRDKHRQTAIEKAAAKNYTTCVDLFRNVLLNTTEHDSNA